MDPSRDRGPQPEPGALARTVGRVLLVAALVWIGIVFFTEQPELSLWIAVVVGAIGYALELRGGRLPNRDASR